MSELFVERSFELESDTFIKQEASANQAWKREAIACTEIRNLVNVFNNNLWPNTRFNQYKETLKKSLEVDKLIEELREKIEVSTKMVSKLETELQTSKQECGLKVAELRSEHRFINRIMQHFEQKIKHDSLQDQEKLICLISICERTKKKLKETLDRERTLESATNICKKFEKLSDEPVISQSTEDFLSEIFFRKLSKVEAECIFLKSFKANLKADNEKLETEIKVKRQEFEVKRNLQMLRLDKSPIIGQICQVSHQIPQISLPIQLRKRFKLCKFCQNEFKS